MEKMKEPTIKFLFSQELQSTRPDHYIVIFIEEAWIYKLNFRA